MNADGGDNFILLCVDYGDVGGARVDYVNFVALGIGGDSGGIGADLEGANGDEAAQVDDSDGVAFAVRYKAYSR